MSQPLLAAYRISFAYAVAGLTHKFRAYCKPVASGAQPWSLLTRDGLSVDTWVASAQGLWANALQGMFASSVAAPTVTLEQLSGTLWLPLDFATLTGAGTNAGTTQASEVTLVVRDTSFKKMRITVLETVEPYLGHSNTGLGLSVSADALTHEYDGTAATAADAFMWQVSRGNRYVLAHGAVAGMTFGLNKRLKRARHDE